MQYNIYLQCISIANQRGAHSDSVHCAPINVAAVQIIEARANLIGNKMPVTANNIIQCQVILATGHTEYT